MIFSSLTFICIFLPAILLLHLALPSIRLKNAALLTASILFYAYGEPVYVLLLLLSALANWAFALCIDRIRKADRWFLAASILFNLSLLCLFKYAAFLAASADALFHLSIPVPRIALPVGISFYTFQAMSYVIDVYRRQCSVQNSYFRLLLYIALFPQLIAGPIVKYRDIESALTQRRVTADGMASGILRFSCGLSKKVLIANYCAVIVDTVYSAPEEILFAPTAWLAAIAYLFQIYFDFSGYSDMAIGLGQMFGFTFHENFNYPYIASSIRDFWRRWHISLSTWLKDYLYIPLGGSRKGRGRTVLNKMIVFLVCGIWHGANVTFLFWGLYHGLLLLLEEVVPFFRRKHSASGRLFLHLYTLLAVLIGFVFFRADTLQQGFRMITIMFSGFRPARPEAAALLWSVLTPAGIAAMAVGIPASLPVRNIAQKFPHYRPVIRVLSLASTAVCILNLAGGTYNPFIYFRF